MTTARTIALVLATSLVTTGCFAGRGAGFRLFEAAVVADVIISAVQPPPPRVIIVPEPRVGFVWQAGYWTQQSGQWVWVDGQWLAQQPNAAWQPTHWEQTPDGQWRLVPGRWVPAQAQVQVQEPPPAAGY